MPEALDRVYWDACVFVSFVEKTPNRITTIDALLYDAAADRNLEIYTSTLSIAEVAYAASERTAGLLDGAVVTLVDDLWRDPTIKVVEFHEVIARMARDRVRAAMVRNVTQQLPTLKAADAVHLATAQWLGASAFHTYDPKLLNQVGLVSFPIVEPAHPRPRLRP